MTRSDEESTKAGNGKERERYAVAPGRRELRQELEERGPEDRDRDELDERALDLDAEEESPFLRVQRRVPVRRGPVTRRTAHRLKIAVLGLAAAGALGGAAGMLYAYGTGSWRFRMDSSDNLEISGNHHVTRGQVMEVFGGDIGRNIFFVPLAQRQAQLEEIPWVQSAAVMRLLPNRLRVQITERTPVAFLRMGAKPWLIDANGVVMEVPRGERYSFPVIVGTEREEPLSTRAARMKTFMRLVGDLDSGGAHYSQALSEVDLDDPEDVKATFADPSGAILVHLGDGQFLERYKVYLAHVNEWRQKFPHMNSVDLRYQREVIVDSSSPPSSSGAPAKTKRTVVRSEIQH